MTTLQRKSIQWPFSRVIAGVGLGAMLATAASAAPAQRKPVRAKPAAAKPAAAQPLTAKPAEPAPPAPPVGTRPEPIGRLGDWFPPESYPTQARARGQEGQTVFALDLDARGRITNCTIVQSSGSDLLDSTTCAQLISNGRFKPARDAEGKPVPGRFQSAMRWKLVEGVTAEDN